MCCKIHTLLVRYSQESSLYLIYLAIYSKKYHSLDVFSMVLKQQINIWMLRTLVHAEFNGSIRFTKVVFTRWPW